MMVKYGSRKFELAVPNTPKRLQSTSIKLNGHNIHGEKFDLMYANVCVSNMVAGSMTFSNGCVSVCSVVLRRNKRNNVQHEYKCAPSTVQTTIDEFNLWNSHPVEQRE